MRERVLQKQGELLSDLFFLYRIHITLFIKAFHARLAP